VKVVFAPEAEAQLLIRKRWWRQHRPKAPERFDQELAAALIQISEMPESFPVYSTASDRVVRRCLLGKANCHLYFEVIAAREVWIVAARGAAQKRRARVPRR
jgi:plasmid stabilization system protein ParE